LDRSANAPAANDDARIAEDIGLAALDLAQRARAAGLTTVGYILESAALEAGAAAVGMRLPADDQPS
jgi:hypothetical protein